MTCFRGGSQSPSRTSCFSNSFSLKYSVCQRGAVFWGGMSRWIKETCSQEGEEVSSQDHPANKHQGLAKTLPPATGWGEDSYV